MTRHLQSSEYSYAPRARERGTFLERLPFIIAALLATLTLATALRFKDDPEGRNIIKDMPFYWQVILLQANRIAAAGEIDEPLSVIVQDEEGASFQNMTGWTEQEQAQIEASMVEAQAFLIDKLGAPLPWTEKNVIVVLNAQDADVQGLEDASAGYDKLGSFFPNVRLLNIVSVDQLENVGLFVHEAQHAYMDIAGPAAFVEGPAVYWQHRFRQEKNGTDEPLMTEDDFARVNQPDLASTPFDEMTLPQKGAFYAVAGAGWDQWEREHQGFFAAQRVFMADFFEKYGRPPSYAIVEDWIRQTYGDEEFDAAIEGNYPWQNPSWIGQ